MNMNVIVESSIVGIAWYGLSSSWNICIGSKIESMMTVAASNTSFTSGVSCPYIRLV
jgi:hypothetical protein